MENYNAVPVMAVATIFSFAAGVLLTLFAVWVGHELK